MQQFTTLIDKKKLKVLDKFIEILNDFNPKLSFTKEDFNTDFYLLTIDFLDNETHNKFINKLAENKIASGFKSQD